MYNLIENILLRILLKCRFLHGDLKEDVLNKGSWCGDTTSVGKMEHIIISLTRKIGSYGCWSGICCKITRLWGCPSVNGGPSCDAKFWAICFDS